MVIKFFVARVRLLRGSAQESLISSVPLPGRSTPVDDLTEMLRLSANSIAVRHSQSAYTTRAAAAIPTYKRATSNPDPAAVTITNSSPLVEANISAPKSVARPITTPNLRPAKIQGPAPYGQSVWFTLPAGKLPACCTARELRTPMVVQYKIG